ncbi:patatin-like phospholipase family protein [Ideonella sp. A 288]|uniref:patatin-like phospholipase family protein n=1 Tax=Ideonella sp. A 288 TaxID=1962181 RepID=UPI000B4B8F9C|nr:patatin-like phospholipase family protein [Ideonella sp. A 288]
MTVARRRSKTVPVDIALQGGGSHGAFTWGVLDALLEDERIVLSGVSGTSAGALNAAVMATGMARNGRAGARAALDAFWGDVSSANACFGLDPFEAANQSGLESHPAFEWFGALMRSVSPYQFNPLGINPLRDVLRRHVDETAMRTGPLSLFVNATSVTTGQARLFNGDDLSIDALLASACLPQLFQAVTIDGVPYWDGGYSGNPALWPLIYHTDALDLLLVRINPLSRAGVPTSAMDILDRVNEITFNAGLVGEMRAIGFVTRLLREQRLDAGRYKSLRMHMVGDDSLLSEYGAASKMNTDGRFLRQLRALGRQAMQTWLQAHRSDLGVRTTVDIEATFLTPRQL